jgi:hypothetical protein
MAGLRPETVQTWGREAQDLEITSDRAAAIASFVDAIAAMLRAASISVPFGSEPSDFLGALHRWRGGRR